MSYLVIFGMTILFVEIGIAGKGMLCLVIFGLAIPFVQS